MAWVYVIHAEGTDIYKIGRTAAPPDRRLITLQASSPIRLEFAYLFETEDSAGLERKLHRLCAKKHSHGEWFRLDQRDLAIIRGAVVSEENPRRLTWERIASASPELASLLREVRAIRREARDGFCALDEWFGREDSKNSLYNRLPEHVGWWVKDRSDIPDFMKTAEAYDFVYDRLLEGLGPCLHEDPCQ